MKTFCNKKTIPLLFILLLLLLPATSFAEFVGSFSRIEGRVDLLRAGATTVAPARRGDGVSTGDIIRTKSDGKAEILFKDNTTVTVASETRLKIDEYTFNPDNSRNKGMLSLLRGKLRAAVSKVKAGLIPVAMGSSTFSVNTPTTVAGVRGTVLFVFFERGVTGVVFKEGHGFVYNQNLPQRIVNVSEGQATFILKEDAPPLPPRPATEAEMSRHLIDTTIDGSQTTNDTTDTSVSLDQPGGGDVSGYNAPKTADTGVDSSPPPPVLPITETDTETLKDSIPPLITITSSPQATTNSASGSFTITANEPVTFTYSIDLWGVTTEITTSDTIELAGLPEGSHTLTITATDEAGNTSTTTYSWTTDYTPPASLALTGTPASITNINTATIGATATDTNGVTYTYTLDGSPSTGTLTSLTEGPHTFVATATDGAGNVSTSSYSWTTDYTAPASLSLTSKPAAVTNINNASIGATATDATTVTYSYTLDGSPSTGSLTGLTEGPHIFVATATDGAGNVSTSSYSWTTDYTAPASLALTGKPAAVTNINNATIGATATDATTVTYSYTLDGSPSTGSLTGLTEGPHTFAVTATDGAGNVSTSSYSWTMDYTAPASLALTGKPAAVTNINNATIGAAATDATTVTYSYTLDGSPSTGSLTGLTEGPHTFAVTATDGAGNVSTSSYSWTTDYTAPASLALTGKPAAVTNINNATIGATATDATTVTYSYTLDGSPSTGSLTGLTEGPHTFAVTATDGAGNVSTSSYSWTTDYTAPASLSLSGTPSSITNVNSATIGATATDVNGVTLSYTLDGSPSTGTLTSLTEGGHTFVATATDGAGNVSTTSYTWTTDYTAPTASISPAASPELTGATAAINVNFGSNETAAYSYNLDGVGWNNVTGSSVNLTGIIEGPHTIDYSATDTAGNPSVPNSLSFALSRYSLSGSAGASGITGSITTGEVAGVSNQNWGGSKLVMSGTYTAMPTSFTLYAGGTSLDATTTNNGGYWIDTINGTSDGVSSLSGTSGLKYLSYDRLGSGTGSFTGSYSLGAWSATDTGIYTETPLAFSGNIGYDQNDQGLYTVDGLGINQIGNSYGGLLGGITPSLSSPTITFMGPYWPSTAGLGPFIWTPVIYSANGSFSFAPSYDGNKFWGYIGGTWKDRAINGRVYSLYIDSSGNAGILKGSLAGAYYPELTMLQADGTWTPTIMGTGVPQTALLADLTYIPSWTWSSTTTTYSGSGNLSQGGVPLDTAMFVTGAEGRKDSITGGNWGIWQTILGGTYTTLGSPDGWNLLTSVIDPPAGKISGTLSVGTWSVNQLAGTTYGYGADISATPNTWISVGETVGTFDPGVLTWQAVQTGAWIDTNKFLAMTTADQAKLAQLNIPFVEVGRAGLTGSGTIGGAPATVNMNNVIFFAYSSGAAPKIWATGDVQGTYNCSACGGGVIPVAGNGLTASFNVQTFDTAGQKWIATVAGSGTYTGTGTMTGTNVIMDGAAAGTNSGTIGGTFSGTSSGVAR